MTLNHKGLTDLLRRAYSAERAAAFAYQGHAGSVSKAEEKEAIRTIEEDEWDHRASVLKIMQEHDITVSRYYEIKFLLIGKLISFGCYVIGWFMPFYFAGRLESGNVCEYFRMMHYFEDLGIRQHHKTLFEMGIKEKEHEVYFLSQVKDHRLLPVFERLFTWGREKNFNDVDMNELKSLADASEYCQISPG